MKRVKVLFRIDGQQVIEESGDISLEQIEKLKWVIASECETNYDNIDVEIIQLPLDLGDIDVGNTGMYNYKDSYFEVKTGVKLSIEIGSDVYLDAINKGILEEYLIFI